MVEGAALAHGVARPLPLHDEAVRVGCGRAAGPAAVAAGAVRPRVFLAVALPAGSALGIYRALGCRIDVPLVRRVVRWESARGQVGRVAAGAARVLALV